MTAKEYLSQAWSIKMRLEAMAEQFAFLKSAALCISPQYSDTSKPASRNIHKNEDAIVRLMDFEERMRKLYTKLDEVMAVIMGIGDPNKQAVIVKRYIDRKTWNEIAVETYVSLRQVHRLHQSVLSEVDERLKDGAL